MDVSINVDRFRSHPVREVVGLLPDQSDATSACDDIEAAGLDVGAAQILVGDDGVRILDVDGTGHGYAARLSRVLSHIGSQENILHLHNDGLVDGETLLSVECASDVASAVADILKRHGGDAIAYFGRGTLAAMSPP